jgi:hypothetical protein
MSLFAQFGTDAAKEAEGVEVKFGPNPDKTIPTFVIARAGRGNPAYAKDLEKSLRPVKRQMEMETLDNETAEAILMGVFIRTVLRGWSHVQDRDGKEIAFSEQAARDLFTQLPELYTQLSQDAQKAALFRENAIEADAKN